MTVIEQWLTTWKAWVAIVAGIAGSAVTFFVVLRKCIVLLNKAHATGAFVMDVEANVKNAIETAIKPVMEKLDRLDEGQQNIIQARRAVMEIDQLKAWFETDPHGKFVWANRMWRTLTGMESDNVRGHGWEAGLDHETREEVLRDWNAAFDHQRLFERQVVLADTVRGTRCHVRLNAWPIRRESDGRILSYLGNATIIANESRPEPRKSSDKD